MMSVLTFAQSPIDKIYEKYSGQDGFTAVNFTKEMFQMMQQIKVGDSASGDMKEVKNIVEQLSGEYTSITFGKLNVDENRKIPMRFGIMSIPTLLYFKDGKLADKTLGALPKKMLEGRLQNLTS